MKSLSQPLSRSRSAVCGVIALASGIAAANAVTNTTGIVNFGNGAVYNATNTTLIVMTPGAPNSGQTAIDFGPSSASFASIYSYVVNGYNAGAWNGAVGGSGNITSSTAAADASLLTSLGIVQNNDTTTNYSTFGGVALTPGAGAGTGQALVKYTYYGDTNLDGMVTGADYSNIDNGFAFALTGWFNGDFNYSGAVTGADYSIIDNAFAFQGPQLLVGDDGKGGGSVVPEPGSIALLLAGGLGIVCRRKRQEKIG